MAYPKTWQFSKLPFNWTPNFNDPIMRCTACRKSFRFYDGHECLEADRLALRRWLDEVVARKTILAGRMKSMIFEADGKRYRMSFAHKVYERPTVLPTAAGGSKPIRGETHCYLVELPPIAGSNQPEPIRLAEAVAHCSIADAYNKEAGRRLALRRALEIAWPTRHEIWGIAFQAYSNRFPAKAKAAA